MSLSLGLLPLNVFIPVLSVLIPGSKGNKELLLLNVLMDYLNYPLGPLDKRKLTSCLTQKDTVKLV